MIDLLSKSGPPQVAELSHRAAVAADLARRREALVTCLDLVRGAGASGEVTLPIVVSPTPK